MRGDGLGKCVAPHCDRPSSLADLIGMPLLTCMLNSSGYAAFSDDPWPLLWPEIERLSGVEARYVLWERPAAAWAASVGTYFTSDLTDFDWLRFAWGVCNERECYKYVLTIEDWKPKQPRASGREFTQFTGYNMAGE